MKKQIRILAAAFAASALTACSDLATFDYATATTPMAEFKEADAVKKTVAVVPFEDRRGKILDPNLEKQAAAHPLGDHGSFYLGFIPLVPSGFVGKAEPEKSEGFVSIGGYDFDIQRDLTDAAFQSLKQSGLFSNVASAAGEEQANADYIWRGIVTNTYYGGNVFSYCVTYLVSPVLWALGAPYGASENDLWVKFELVENATGKVVWTYDYRGNDYVVQWIYARIGKDASMYPELMRQAMNGALWELSHVLPTLDR